MTPRRDPARAGALPEGIEAVLFDLDDTLVDTRSAWRAAFAGVLASAYARYPQLEALGRGEHVHDAVFQPLVRQEQAADGGEWDREFLRRGFRRLLAEHASHDDEFADGLFGAYVAAQPRGMALFPDVLPTLGALGARYRLALVSNGLGPQQRSRIQPLGLDAHFPVIAISGELGVRKPDPAIFRHVLSRLGVAASAAVHVGDDPQTDVAGARAAGVATVWVNRDGATHDGDHAADAEITAIAEVPGLLRVR